MTTIVNGTTGITFSDSSVQNTAAIGFRNRIINGGMSIDQRNNGGAVNASTTSAYIVDRWSCVASTTVSGTLQYGRGSATNWGAGTNALYFYRGSGTYAGALKAVQPIESVNCLDLAGQTVTLSFYSFVGSAWLGGAITAAVLTSTGTDQTATQFFAGSATGQATAGSTGVTPTTSYQRFTVSASIPANATQVAVFFQTSNWSGTGSANDFVYITGVQLEKATTASSFDFRSYGTEFALCQRYYYVMAGFYIEGYANSGSIRAVTIPVNFPVTMRATPTRTVITTGSYTNIRANSSAYAGLGLVGLSATFTSATIESNAAGYTQCNNQTESMSAEL